MPRSLLALLTLGLLAAYSVPLAMMIDTRAPAPFAVVVGGEQNGWYPAGIRSDRPVALWVDNQPMKDPRWVRIPDHPGLHTASWSMSYLGQPAKQVAHSFITGPYLTDGWIRNAARVSIAQHLLDDGVDRQKGDLSTAIVPLLKRYLSSNPELREYAGRVQNLELRVAINSYSVDVKMVATFKRGVAEYSKLVAAVRLKPKLTNGTLTVVPSIPRVPELDGAARRAVRNKLRLVHGGAGAAGLGYVFGPWGVVAGLILGAETGKTSADRKIDTKLRVAAHNVAKDVGITLNRALAAVLTKQMQLNVIHPRLTLEWKPSGLMMLPGQSINVLFDVRIRADGSTVKYASYGPVALGDNISGAADVISDLRIDLSGNLVNSLGHTLWQSGIFDELFNNPTLIGKLTTKKVRELLAFDLNSVAFTLPPTVSRWSAGVVRLNVGGVDLGLKRLEDDQWIPNTISLHGSLSLRPKVDTSKKVLKLTVEPAPLLASCGKGTPAEPLVPCLSQLVGIANRMLPTEGAFNFNVELGGILDTFQLGVGSANLTARVEPVSMGIVEVPTPAIRADANLFLQGD